MNSMVCQSCFMTVTPANAYHPHLFCVLWKTYHVDPAALLARHDYVREIPDDQLELAIYLAGRPLFGDDAQADEDERWLTIAAEIIDLRSGGA